jgi:hypothetical protein
MSDTPTQERRSAARYRLQLPVIFQWEDDTRHTEGGFTTDIAIDGALILSSRVPPVGAGIRIQVLIPSPDHPLEELRIACAGTVTRVWEQPGCSYFGVHGSFNDEALTRHVIGE